MARTSETSAMWTGVVVGVGRLNEIPLQGTATIDIDDFNDPNVDVSFSLRELPGTSTSQIGWTDIPISEGAFSRTGGPTTSIEGRFYGDSHEEVGGIFRTLNLYGAFGATRQP